MEHFTNRSAITLWVTAPILVVVMALGTAWFASNGLPEKNPTLILGMMSLLWMAVLWFTWVAMSASITRVQVDLERRVSVVRRFPHKTVHTVLERKHVRPAEVIEVRDAEGGDVFIARVSVTDGATFDIATTNSRDSCEEACWRFNAALFGSSGRRRTQ